MIAVILAGGLGTRISEETTLKPKPMVTIGGMPVLWHIMKGYSAHGINDFIICCGYKGYVIKEYFSNYFLHTSDVTFDMRSNQMEVHSRNAEPWRVTLVDTGQDTLTGGRLKRVQSYLKNEEAFCFTYGDGVSDVDIDASIAFHKQHGRLATMTAVQPPGRFGAIDIDGQRITSFKEKPQGDGAWVNGGYFVLSPRVIDYIAGDDTTWEKGPMETLAQEGQLDAFRHHGFWQPMDTLRDRVLLEDLWEKGRAPLEALAMKPSFWRGKRVFLTGHTGFKGSWLSLWLQQMGAQLTGFALAAPSQPSLYDVANVGSGMTSVSGDIRDAAALSAAMQSARPEIVIHMAAQALVRYSYAHPVDTYSTNVMGLVNLFEAVRATSGVRAVVNVTSDKCYENREWDWGYRENEPLGGHDPYSNSKACAELVTAGYRNSFFHPDRHAGHGVALASARAGNVIGGGDWAQDRLIPDMMRAIAAGTPVAIRNPHAIRPWQHVLEPLAGYLTLARHLFEQGGAYAEGFNFGPHDSDARPVEWIVARLCASWGEGARWQLDEARQPHEASYLKLDCSKAHRRLGWQPRWHLGQTIDHIVAWHRAHAAGADMRALTLAQIAAYQDGGAVLAGR